MTLAESLESMLPAGESRRFGQLLLTRSDSGSYHARHQCDAGEMGEKLTPVKTPEEMREIARVDADGAYRALPTAPSLVGGWEVTTDSADEFLLFLDSIYPSVFASWVAYEKGEIEPTSLRDTLVRHGIDPVSDARANQVMRTVCAMGCIRTIAWPLDKSCAVSRLKAHPRSIPTICLEACPIALDAAKK
jgi:hypothetical protein